MTTEDIYRPPGVEAPAAHSSFTKDEWRYMGKVFAWWVVGGSACVGVWLTIMTVDALKAFDAAGRTGGIVGASAIRAMAPCVVIFAACNALVTVIDRRTKSALPPPINGLPVSGLVVLYVAVPVAACIIIVASFVTNTLGYDGSSDEWWSSMRATVAMTDPPFGMAHLLILAMLLGVTAPQAMRLLSRFPGWLPLKFFVLWQLCKWLGWIVGNILAEVHVAFM